MKTALVLSLGLASLLLAGCATPFRAPADVAGVKLETEDSPVVIVDKIWLERKGGALFLKGYVTKRLLAEDTTQTHLDVILYDESGRVLRSSIEHFEPSLIVSRPRQLASAAYQVSLDPLPPTTVRIRVKADEAKH